MGRRDSLLIMHQHSLFQLLVGCLMGWGDSTIPSLEVQVWVCFCKHPVGFFLSHLSEIHITKGDGDFVHPAATAQGLNGLMTHSSASAPAHWGGPVA